MVYSTGITSPLASWMIGLLRITMSAKTSEPVEHTCVWHNNPRLIYDICISQKSQEIWVCYMIYRYQHKCLVYKFTTNVFDTIVTSFDRGSSYKNACTQSDLTMQIGYMYVCTYACVCMYACIYVCVPGFWYDHWYFGLHYAQEFSMLENGLDAWTHQLEKLILNNGVPRGMKSWELRVSLDKNAIIDSCEFSTKVYSSKNDLSSICIHCNSYGIKSNFTLLFVAVLTNWERNKMAAILGVIFKFIFL